jgi:DMSO/TMAO reductase YedYZ molybdopterin-dependent catalytic subunit
VQALLFDPNKLAPEYPESAITRPFPFNAFYPEDKAPVIDPGDFHLDITGLTENQKPWTLKELHALPRFTQITRHICIEGWSAIGKWTGVRFSDFLARIGADLSAKYVTFRCDDNYITSIDMPTALHPQTQLTFWFDGGASPQIWFPDEAQNPDQARLQKSEAHRRDRDRQ